MTSAELHQAKFGPKRKVAQRRAWCHDSLLALPPGSSPGSPSLPSSWVLPLGHLAARLSPLLSTGKGTLRGEKATHHPQLLPGEGQILWAGRKSWSFAPWACKETRPVAYRDVLVGVPPVLGILLMSSSG